MTLFRLSHILLSGLVVLSPALADQQIYRCTVNGKTTFTDKPCHAQVSPGVIEPGASAGGRTTGSDGKRVNSFAMDYTTPYGTWHGQAQYQASRKGQVVPEAHAVVPLVIEVEKQGRVLGASPDNGCRMLGVASPSVTSTILHLDVTLSGCGYPTYNRRYSGTLALYKASNSVQLSLQSLSVGLAALDGRGGYFDIKATLRR